MKPAWACEPIPKPAPRKPARRRPVKPVSDKRLAERPIRQAVLEEVERRDGWRCAAEGILPGHCGHVGLRQQLEGHEIRPRGRQPGSHLDPAQVRLLCPYHHDQVTGATGSLLVLVVEAGFLLPAEPLAPVVNTKGQP